MPLVGGGCRYAKECRRIPGSVDDHPGEMEVKVSCGSEPLVESDSGGSHLQASVSPRTRWEKTTSYSWVRFAQPSYVVGNSVVVRNG